MRGESTPRRAPPGPLGNREEARRVGRRPRGLPLGTVSSHSGRLPGRRASFSLQDDPLGKGDSAEERGGGWTEPAPLLAARRRRGRARREQVSAVAGRVVVVGTFLAVAGLVVVTASTPCADRDTAGPVSRRARGLRAARSERWLRVSVRQTRGPSRQTRGRTSRPWGERPLAARAVCISRSSSRPSLVSTGLNCSDRIQ